MKILETLFNKVLAEYVTEEKIKTLFGKIVSDVGVFVAGTENTIDDALWEGIQKDVDLDKVAELSADWIRGLFGLDGMRFVGGYQFFNVQPPPMESGDSPTVEGRSKVFLNLVRARLVSEACKNSGCSRAKAREAVNKITDTTIMAAASGQGVAMGAIGDGTILEWLRTHLPDMLKLVATLLPLILSLL